MVGDRSFTSFALKSRLNVVILDVHPTVSLISSSPSPPSLFLPPFVNKIECITVDHTCESGVLITPNKKRGEQSWMK